MSSSSASSSNGTSMSGKVARTSKNLFKFSGLIHYQCDYCGITETILKLCGNCRVVAYCSKECQLTGWKKHKTQCKKKNPMHFNREARQKIDWFLQLANSATIEDGHSEMLKYLVDSFRVRCLDEEAVSGVFPEQTEISMKFARFLHAAKGTAVLPSSFSKLQFLTLRNDAHRLHRLADLSQGRSFGSILEKCSSSGTENEMLENLRILHTVICGPVRFENERYNII